MAQLKKVVEPFGEVNVHPGSRGNTRVTATILMEPHREGAQTGIAIDGSGSMSEHFGINSSALASVFKRPTMPNVVSPVAQKICAYLARKIDADGGTTVVYWATGTGGREVELVGDLTAAQAEAHAFNGPKSYGSGTRLLPAVKYFVERFASAPWGFYVFITDGELHDLEEVKDYTRQLAKSISAKKRNPVKLLLVGVGADANEKQMEELDDLDTGTDVDVWDHKMASELKLLQRIFAEVVDKNARVAPSGRILDPSGRVLKDYSRGVPAFLEFEAPTSATYFTLEVEGNRFHQGLSDTARVPASDGVAVAEDVVKAEENVLMAELVEEPPKPAPAPKPAPTPQPVPAAKPKDEEPKDLGDMSGAAAVPPTGLGDMTEAENPVGELLSSKGPVEDDKDDRFLDFDLQMDKDEPDLGLEKS